MTTQEIIYEHMRNMAAKMGKSMAETYYGPSTPPYVLDKAPEPSYACEVDKPAGTRDPDKFLKEQQDKLWKEMME